MGMTYLSLKLGLDVGVNGNSTKVNYVGLYFVFQYKCVYFCNVDANDFTGPLYMHIFSETEPLTHDIATYTI